MMVATRCTAANVKEYYKSEGAKPASHVTNVPGFIRPIGLVLASYSNCKIPSENVRAALAVVHLPASVLGVPSAEAWVCRSCGKA